MSYCHQYRDINKLVPLLMCQSSFSNNTTRHAALSALTRRRDNYLMFSFSVCLMRLNLCLQVNSKSTEYLCAKSHFKAVLISLVNSKPAQRAVERRTRARRLTVWERCACWWDESRIVMRDHDSNCALFAGGDSRDGSSQLPSPLQSG